MVMSIPTIIFIMLAAVTLLLPVSFGLSRDTNNGGTTAAKNIPLGKWLRRTVKVPCA
jgi:hypothetical protein